jgi:membrane associated rhomboid family serine protease
VRRFPLAVVALVVLNVAVFVVELAQADRVAFIDAFALIPYDLANGIALPPPSPSPEWLTIVTAMFIHGGWLHVGVNMLFLAAFGPDVESEVGHASFLALYLGCGLAGNIVQAAVDPGSHVPSVGASGAIAGILGAYLLTYPLRIGPVLFIAFWAGLQFVHGIGALSSHVESERTGGTAYLAHIGGFVAGLVLVEVVRMRERRR